MREDDVAIIFLSVLLVGAVSQSTESPKAGELVLRAVDIDTGKPIPGVSFSIGNSLAEDWATKVGNADEHGTLRLRTVNKPGYYYSVWPLPKEYDVAGLDDVKLTITPGRVTTHTFQLRNVKSKPKLPPIVDLPAEYRHRVPTPGHQPKNVKLVSTVDDMPGFEGKRVKFEFYSDKAGKISPEQLARAEKIFINGKRVRAAVRDQLAYFQKAVPADHGDIDGMSHIRIEFGERGSNFWCRLPQGMKLRDGYGIYFDHLDRWNLYVPDYQQPDFGR